MIFFILFVIIMDIPSTLYNVILVQCHLYHYNNSSIFWAFSPIKGTAYEGLHLLRDSLNSKSFTILYMIKCLIYRVRLHLMVPLLVIVKKTLMKMRNCQDPHQKYLVQGQRDYNNQIERYFTFKRLRWFHLDP